MDKYLRALRAMVIWGFGVGAGLLLCAGIADAQARAIGYEPEMSGYATLASALLVVGGASTCLAAVAVMVWLGCKSMAVGQAAILAALTPDAAGDSPA